MTYTHGIVMVFARTHDIDMDSWYLQGLMVETWTHGIDNTNGSALDSWYRIASPESHTYKCDATKY